MRTAFRRCVLLLGLALLATPGWAAVSFVASTTSAPSSGTVSSLTLTAPAGLTTNDVMVAFLTANVGSQPNIRTPPAGWTLLFEKNDGQNLGVVVYYRVATGSDSAGSSTYTWGFDNPARAAGGLMAFRGASTSSPIVASGSSVNGSSINYSAPSITPGVANTMLVALYSVGNGNTQSLSNPSGMTQAYDVSTQNGSSGALIGGFYGTVAASTATGTRTTISGASLSSISIGALLALQPATASGASRYLITYANYGLYCLNQTVTVSVLDAGGSPVASYAGTMTLSTTTGRGSWSLSSGGGTLTDSTPDDGLASYLWPGNSSTATFALSYRGGATPVTVDAVDTVNATLADDNTQGAIAFSPSGFTVTSSPFSNPAGGVPAFATPKVAGNNFSVYLTAYGQNPTDATCGIITSYAGAKSLKFWSTYVNPATGTIAATINAAAIATTEGAAAAQSVTFTSGQATVTAKYLDAGSLSLSMKDDTTGNPSLPTGIRGTTGTFVSVPANFTVSNIKRSSDNFANPAASTASGTVFATAGQSFTATITAVTSGGAATPNFGRESPAETVAFTSTLVLPASGHNPAVTGTAGTFSNGVATGTAFAWPEVGIVTLAAHIADSSYLGGADVVGSSTGNVGRFVPNSFGVALNTPLFGTPCTAGSFGYVGQPFTYTVAPVITVTALAFGGATAQNYTGTLFRLTNASLTGRSYTPTPASPALDVSGLPATSADPTIADLGTGQATLTFSAGSGLSYSRGAAIAPFTANIALAINVIDLDSTGAANPVTFGASSGIAFSSGATQRYGRLALRNRVGSELLDLPLSLTAEYYLSPALGFTTHLADSCSTAPALAFSAYQSHLSAGETCVRDQGSPGVSGVGCAAAAGLRYRATALAGDFNLVLAAPGSGNDGAVTVTASAPAWLRYLWNSASGTASNPSGMATFGLFPGPTSRIYQREVLQ